MLSKKQNPPKKDSGKIMSYS